MKPCTCPAVTTRGGKQFPHRRCDRCEDAEMEALDVMHEMHERTRAEWAAEELALFNRAEADAINAGARPSSS